MYKLILFSLFAIGCSRTIQPHSCVCKDDEVSETKKEIVSKPEDPFESCAIDSIHDHALDAKSGIQPKQCNGYTFNIVYVENSEKFRPEDNNGWPKWSRFDSRCEKVDIANPPNGATHRCNYITSVGSPIRRMAVITAKVFVKVEKVID